jgi:DNA-binding NarL/FixJ family response regulator
LVFQLPNGSSGDRRAIRILIVHENRFFREGLALALIKHGGFEVAGHTLDLPRGIELPKEAHPDVILLQAVGTKDSPRNFIKKLTGSFPQARVVVFGVPDSDRDIINCIEAGAIGYVLRDASLSELVEVIRAAAGGEVIASPRITASLCRRLAKVMRFRGRPLIAGSQPLTPREQEIVSLIAAGLQNKEIAVRLGIEVQTVKNHVHNILEKLGMGSRYEVARRAHLMDLT